MKLGYIQFKLYGWIIPLTVLVLAGFVTEFSSAQGIDPTNLHFQYLSLENGLPNNKVNAVTMDKEGFMWFGTNDGVCRYDGYTIKNYPLDLTHGNQIRTPQISILRTDSNGNLLIGSYSLFRYNYSSDKIEKCDTSTDGTLIDRVYSIEEGIDGQFWIGTVNGLFSYNPKTKLLTAYRNNLQQDFTILSILSDSDKLWIASKNNGILVFDIANNNFQTIPKFILPAESKNQVNCLYKDNKNVIWAGTQDNGIFKFNLIDSSLTHSYPNVRNNLSYRIRKIVNDRYGNIWVGCRLGIFLQKTGSDSLIQVRQPDPLTTKSRSNSIYDIFIDHNEIMWLGTFSFGVSYTDIKRKPFYKYALSDENTLFFAKLINCLTDCDSNNIWIGTEENGLFCFNRRTMRFRQYLSDPKDKNSLSGSNIKTLARESNGNLWIGHYTGGIDLLIPKTGKITHFNTENNKEKSLSSNSIRSLILDNEENLYIGTEKGVDIRKKNSQTFLHLNLNLEVLTLYKDNDNRIWVGTSGNGIYLLKKDSLIFERKYPTYITSTAKNIHVDSRKNLWVGTNKGLFFIDVRTDSMLYFGTTQGLPSNRIFDILEDNNSNLWISTGAGLVKCESAVSYPANFTIKKYSVADGLQSLLFRETASYKNKNGEFYFGGIQGFNIFNPDSIRSNPYPPELAFTELKIFNQKVEIGEKIRGSIVLDKAINESMQVQLSHKHSPVTIEFAALHFSDPGNNQYRYRLSPIEEEWNYTSGIRNFATYSNLKGGEYTFIVEGANGDGLWNPDPLVLKIKVFPPFWETWWFVGIVFLIISSSIYGYYRLRVSLLKEYNTNLEKEVEDRTRELKESLNQILDKQTFIEEQSKILIQQKEQLQELNSTKDKFFSIIAHDLRSPFQSLLGISELLVKETDEIEKADQKIFAKTMNDSANHLFSLVENLLTWSRTQTNKISFTPEGINLSSLIDNVISQLYQNVSQKNIKISISSATDKSGYADKNMIEMVIRNLISNAIKFTPGNGIITIRISEDHNYIEVEINDTGVGISIEDQNKLFRIDSNFSRAGTNGEKGTGLGLILCNEFVEKNEGRIWVKSSPGNGSSFFFTIPVL